MKNKLDRIKELYKLAEDDEKTIAELYNLTRELEAVVNQRDNEIKTIRAIGNGMLKENKDLQAEVEILKSHRQTLETEREMLCTLNKDLQQRLDTSSEKIKEWCKVNSFGYDTVGYNENGQQPYEKKAVYVDELIAFIVDLSDTPLNTSQVESNDQFRDVTNMVKSCESCRYLERDGTSYECQECMTKEDYYNWKPIESK